MNARIQTLASLIEETLNERLGKLLTPLVVRDTDVTWAVGRDAFTITATLVPALKKTTTEEENR